MIEASFVDQIGFAAGVSWYCAAIYIRFVCNDKNRDTAVAIMALFGTSLVLGSSSLLFTQAEVILFSALAANVLALVLAPAVAYHIHHQLPVVVYVEEQAD